MLNNKQNLYALSLGALGVVYGDIGTSPLYTLNTIFTAGKHPVTLNADNILGILSLIFWSLMIVVSFKYVAFIMRADNRGEGGIMALLALVLGKLSETGNARKTILILGLCGASLFYGDGVITPAISVLSAVEGLQVASPSFKDYIVPITLVILVALFFIQRKGTAKVGALFGPIMVAWFFLLALLGLLSILEHPGVLHALNPLYAVNFLRQDLLIGFLSLGGVVLALTGAEALYADMGHFGKKPIQLAWFYLVLPALVLNYFGQGALLIANPKAIENPFFLLAPHWALYPMVVISTIATIIASQAVISGAFSMTDQAIKLGYAPRMETQHTSEDEIGQIYVPGINWSLMVAVLSLVLVFKSSAALAAAYGIAVTGTMFITSILAFIVVHKLWGWSIIKGALLISLLLCIDGVFFSANLVKVEEGGWLPLSFGLLIFTLMTTWKKGRVILAQRLKREAIDLIPFVNSVSGDSITHVPGSAVFLTSNPDGVPSALMHNMKHNKVIHEKVVVLAVRVLDIPHVPVEERILYNKIDDVFHQMTLRFGFMDEPNVPLALFSQRHVMLESFETSFFLSRETLIPKTGSDMSFWREKLFIAMFRNAGSAIPFFKIPPNRVVEIGAQVVL
ncbi:MAG: potassium transporter Kup [Ferrovum sp. 37-45-19]|jgi:KUP system potassium uptake protein|uniref:potassium transporter Kup n=1 Tax=Ferrovum sp. JA12 TaxID=1356299 RepID=UPI00070358EA|nr:potassium transporter Kup [Ferrovum sp. JA12]OYV78758.1 MAG: potassium transporter Kup [Ferrovum sp. 21-44-67]OYV93936.1 MAG: potassium transporter Kup [Ferrovum sp. 37-45-19]OZB31996.1 MAG: potassium transporter Kup [Ferrovum sp. 34-44-207]HQT81994.1 potassium transporter Kup [Ferrovaceae bacterium]KRH78977.1 Low affinity potassium transport system protein kup [Ferrovum sp. JA12]